MQLAKDAVRNFERLGATYIKIGQVLSVRHVLATSYLPLSWIACSYERGTGVQAPRALLYYCFVLPLDLHRSHL